MDFELNWGKMVFLVFSLKEAVFEKKLTTARLRSRKGLSISKICAELIFPLVLLGVDFGRYLWKVALASFFHPRVTTR